MDPTIPINQRVEIISVFYKSKEVTKVCLPVKMRYQNREIVFSHLGMRHPTAKGKRMIHVFDVSDGTNDYRLEFDAEALTWTLVSMIGGGS